MHLAATCGGKYSGADIHTVANMGLHTGADGLLPERKPIVEQVYPEGLESMQRTHTGAWEKCEEEGLAERNCYRLTQTPINLPLWHSGVGGGRGVRNEGES